MNKNALITAGSKNTGFQTARKLAQNGFDIHITSRSENDAVCAAENLKKEFPNISAYGYSLELSDVSDIKNTFEKIKKTLTALMYLSATPQISALDLTHFQPTKKPLIRLWTLI